MSEKCSHWKSLSAGESPIGDNVIENFANDEVSGVSVIYNEDPFKPLQVENTYADVYYQPSVLDNTGLRKCAAVVILDGSLGPYTHDISRCNKYNCDAKISAVNIKENECGNI